MRKHTRSQIHRIRQNQKIVIIALLLLQWSTRVSSTSTAKCRSGGRSDTSDNCLFRSKLTFRRLCRNSNTNHIIRCKTVRELLSLIE